MLNFYESFVVANDFPSITPIASPIQASHGILAAVEGERDAPASYIVHPASDNAANVGLWASRPQRSIVFRNPGQSGFCPGD